MKDKKSDLQCQPDSGLATHVSKDKAQCTLLKEGVHSNNNVTKHAWTPMIISYRSLDCYIEYGPAGNVEMNQCKLNPQHKTSSLNNDLEETQTTRYGNCKERNDVWWRQHKVCPLWLYTRLQSQDYTSLTKRSVIKPGVYPQRAYPMLTSLGSICAPCRFLFCIESGRMQFASHG